MLLQIKIVVFQKPEMKGILIWAFNFNFFSEILHVHKESEKNQVKEFLDQRPFPWFCDMEQ